MFLEPIPLYQNMMLLNKNNEKSVSRSPKTKTDMENPFAEIPKIRTNDKRDTISRKSMDVIFPISGL